jgi:uncharacterized protein
LRSEAFRTRERLVLRERLSRYRDRVRRELTSAFQEEHTPHELGTSFSIAVFVTAMPTGGLGIPLLAGLAAWRPWVNKPAMIAAVALLNPLVKPAVYVASYQLGGAVLSTRDLESDDPFTTSGAITETAGIAIRQLLVGNLLLAASLSVFGYALIVRLTKVHRRQESDSSNQSFLSVVLDFFRRP